MKKILAVLVIFVTLTVLFLNRKQTSEIPVSVETVAKAENTSEVIITDKRLVLVNCENILPNDYKVTPAFYDTITVDNMIYKNLVDMINAASYDGLCLWLSSGYRSVEEQEEIFNEGVRQRVRDGMNKKEAEENACLTIQKPGYSEHHTGLAVDFNCVTAEFGDTEEYEWLCENAERYGFVQRYKAEKADITKISEEVWHFRYVGRENAEKMNKLDMCLEEYLEYLKEKR